MIVSPTCDLAAYALRVRGHPCDGTDANVRCTRNGAETLIELRIPPNGYVFDLQWVVEPQVPDVRFDYQLSFQLR